MIKENNKYHLPIEINTIQLHRLLKIKTYEYKLYADPAQTKFTKIKFIDINGFIIGEHMPVKLQTIYDRAANQIKNNTVKAVSEIKGVVDGVADIAVGVVSEVKGDVSNTAKQTVGIATNLFGKFKNKFYKQPDVETTLSPIEEKKQTDNSLNT